MEDIAEPNEAEIDARQIASASLEILRDEGATNQPYYMSKLGTRLSAKFGKPLRSLLGAEKLSVVLLKSLGNILTFEGQGATLAVRINEANAASRQTLRYDPAIWAAFSKPVPDGMVRFLIAQRPFKFNDANANSSTSGGIEVERDRIPDASLSKPERESHIKHQIEDWCQKHSISSASLLLVTEGKKALSAPASRDIDPNRKAIINFIEAIPSDERSRYSLPLDLIHRLLNK